ncbi:MAG TPA: hypothetical protein VG106_03645, partial [Vicinamibacterales bacterium]|nr:hypothetical protein [Vicinamibacterales bacterium]
MRLYRALLALYPASFRHEYGREMEHDFELRRRDASGLVSRLGVWLEAIGDLIVNAMRVHLEMLRGDVRYALRAFRRAPGFALTAIVVTALGIGANTAVFPLADRVLIRPLPYADADRLVKLWEDVPGY